MEFHLGQITVLHESCGDFRVSRNCLLDLEIAELAGIGVIKCNIFLTAQFDQKLSVGNYSSLAVIECRNARCIRLLYDIDTGRDLLEFLLTICHIKIGESCRAIDDIIALLRRSIVIDQVIPEAGYCELDCLLLVICQVFIIEL